MFLCNNQIENRTLIKKSHFKEKLKRKNKLTIYYSCYSPKSKVKKIKSIIDFRVENKLIYKRISLAHLNEPFNIFKWLERL